MNIPDFIHAQFNAYKLPSEYYAKYIFMGILFFAGGFSNFLDVEVFDYSISTGLIFTILIIILSALDKVIVADMSSSSIYSVWRLFNIPIVPRFILSKDINAIVLNYVESKHPENNTKVMEFKVTCHTKNNELLEFVYLSRRYKVAKSLADWLVKRLSIPLDNQVFNDGKIADVSEIDDSFLKSYAVSKTFVLPSSEKNNDLTITNGRDNFIRLPSRPYPFYFLIFWPTVIGLFSAFFNMLVPEGEKPIIIWIFSFMFIMPMIGYFIKLFPVDIEINNATLVIKKSFIRKKIRLNDLVDILIHPHRLVLRTRKKYYLLPYYISEEQARQVRAMIMNSPKAKHIILSQLAA